MMKLRKKAVRRRGITLAEMAVALALIMIVSVATTSLYLSVSEKEKEIADTMAHNEHVENIIECYQWANGNEEEFYGAMSKLGYQVALQSNELDVDFPNCTESGFIACACDKCGGSIVYLAPTGHVWSKVTYNFAEDGSSCIAERTCKRDGNHKETAEATITERGEAFCTKMGTTTYTATFSEDVTWAETQTKDVQDIPALGHVDAENDGNHICDRENCEAIVTPCGDDGKDHDCDADSACTVYRTDNNEHKDTNSDHICEYGCPEAIGVCEDTDKDHACDYGCDKYFGTHADGDDADHKCDYCQGDVCVDSNEDGKCDECESPMADESTNESAEA